MGVSIFFFIIISFSYFPLLIIRGECLQRLQRKSFFQSARLFLCSCCIKLKISELFREAAGFSPQLHSSKLNMYLMRTGASPLTLIMRKMDFPRNFCDFFFKPTYKECDKDTLNRHFIQQTRNFFLYTPW